LIGNLVQLILRVHTEAAHDRGECDGWRVIASGWLVLELVRIRIVCFQLLQLASLELSRPRVLELVEALANGLFADVDGSGDLGRCPPEAMNFGSDQDGCSAQSVRPTAFGHPAAIHRLYEPNSGILDVLELVFELKLEAKLLDVERGVNDRNTVLFQQNLATKFVEHLSNTEKVLVDCICEVDKEVGAPFDSTRHIEAGRGNNFCLTPLRHRVVAGDLVVAEA
jgi:hypothetical protein